MSFHVINSFTEELIDLLGRWIDYLLVASEMARMTTPTMNARMT